MKRRDVKIGMKVVPFKKSLTWSLAELKGERAKENLARSSEWHETKDSDHPFLYVIEITHEEGFEFLRLSARSENKNGDYFLPKDLRPYEGK